MGSRKTEPDVSFLSTISCIHFSHLMNSCCLVLRQRYQRNQYVKANFKPTASEIIMNVDSCISVSPFSSIATYSRIQVEQNYILKPDLWICKTLKINKKHVNSVEIYFAET